MTTTTTNQSLQAQEKLPDVVVLRSGSRFKPLGDHWMLMDGVTRVSFNFHLLPPEVTPLLFSLKRTLINFLQNNSPRYAKNMFDRFCDLAGILAEGRAPVSQIDALHLINFAARVNSDDHLGRESQVSAVLSRWHSLGLPGISDAAVSFLRSRKKKGNRKGVAVLTLDPVRGPFTELELQGLLSAVTQAFADNRITEQHFMLTWLVALTGQRSVQYCALKAKDVVVTHAHCWRRPNSDHPCRLNFDQGREAVARTAICG